MKLSIWRQFSSNHSANFTVIGEFESPGEAQQAAGEIRRLLAGIADYYADPQHRQEYTRRGAVGDPLPLTPIEIEFAAKYDISPDDWTGGQGGIDWSSSEDEVDSAMHTYERLVFVDNGRDTWQGPMPIPILLEKLGGKISLSAEDVSWLVLTVSCAAPDTAAADALEKELSTPFELRYNTEPASPGRLPDIWETNCKRDGLHFVLEDLIFEDPDECAGLAGLVEALTSRGFTQIEYVYVQEE